MTASAQGIDVSAYQNVLTAAGLAGLGFCFVKASEGATSVDVNFAANWAVMKTAGIHRGCYHEMTADPSAPAGDQAGHFIATVNAQGAEPGDMLAVVASDYAGVTGDDVLTWLDAVKAAFPTSPVLVYSDLSVLPELGACTGYPLWLAYYSDAAPESVAPWDSWTFWQYQGTTAPDNDAYNGTAAQLEAWLQTYVPNPDAWVFTAVRGLAVVGTGPHSVRLSWSAPGTPAPEAVDHYQLTVRHLGQDVAEPVDITKGPNPQVYQWNNLTPKTDYELFVRAVAINGHAGPWATVTFTTPES